MPATIVEIKEVIKHPNADNLTIYKVSNNFNVDNFQVIANNENVYKLGDKAIYILPGSVLLDGTKIKERKIRDVNSYGMLAGFSNYEIGTDVTGTWCDCTEEWQVTRTKLKHQPWPSIESFAHVRRTVATYIKQGKDNQMFHIKYGGKVKLHGTNAAVQITPEGEVVAQKRSSIIYPDQDNVGFAQWVFENQEAFKAVAKDYRLVIHGEWFGPSIQKGVACSDIPIKSFAVFALQLKSLDGSEGVPTYYVDPSQIERMIGMNGPWYILPWAHELFIDFTDNWKSQKAIAEITNKVLEVEQCDPFIKNNFGVEGIGEGLVYFPMFGDLIDESPYSIKEFIFKAKGKKHQSNAHKTTNEPVDIEKLNSVKEFVDKFVTESRLEQGFTEAVNRKADTKLIGTFLKWVSDDVEKESVAELEESNITWNDIRKQVMTYARCWYQNLINESV
jgi:tRNA-binding EMAP/Myf-like protein